MGRRAVSAMYAAAFVMLAAAAAIAIASHAGNDSREAYILVKEGTVRPLWGYQQLPMHDCAWCHRAVNLNRHHVVPQAANPSLRDVRENLVVLCRDCHFVLGHRCNWKQYNPDVLYICTHFTNCVRSADTRYGVTSGVGRVRAPATNAERILHVTNDVPGNMRSALERILKSDAK